MNAKIKDVSDLHRNIGPDAVRRAIENHEEPRDKKSQAEDVKGGPENSHNQAPEQKKKQVDYLLEAAEGLTFFHDEQKEAFVQVPINGHTAVYKVRSKDFKLWLTQQVYITRKKSPNSDSMNQALTNLESRALFDGQKHKLSLRMAEHEGSFYYDMTDDKWRAVQITPEGWQILERPPVIFQRSRYSSGQVDPVKHGGNCQELLKFINLTNEDEQVLLLAYLITCLVPGIHHPVLVIGGEKGTAKSTMSRIMKKLIDPAIEELQAIPPDRGDSLILILSKNYAVFFDNTDGVTAWQSDTLCMGVTGGSSFKRKLYTDDEEIMLVLKRGCIGLNGIATAATRSDLLHRSLLFTLESIPKHKRREEAEFWESFDDARPRIIGGMLDALAGAMKIYPTVTLKEKHRLADFLRWGYSAAESMGIGGERFLQAFWNNVKLQNEAAIDNHPVALAVVAFMRDHKTWENTAGKLLDCLERIAEDERINVKSKTWPQSANKLPKRLLEVKANLEDVGIRFTTRKETRGKIISIERIENFQRVADLPSVSSYRHKDCKDKGFHNDDTMTINETEKVSSSVPSYPNTSNDKGCDDNDGNDNTFPYLRKGDVREMDDDSDDTSGSFWEPEHTGDSDSNDDIEDKPSFLEDDSYGYDDLHQSGDIDDEEIPF